VRHIAISHRQNYEKHESYDSVRELLLGHGIVSAIGEDWRRQRKLMAPFFTPRAVERFYPIFLADTQQLIHRWRGLQGGGQPVDMFDEMMQITASIILHAVFSTESDETLHRIRGAVERQHRLRVAAPDGVAAATAVGAHPRPPALPAHAP
jgi:cytochrome P450